MAGGGAALALAVAQRINRGDVLVFAKGFVKGFAEGFARGFTSGSTTVRQYDSNPKQQNLLYR